MNIVLNALIKELSAIYDQLRDKYISNIDTAKETDSIGGTYYGRTELFSTRGTHFEKTIGYDHQPGYYGVPRYYDFVFKVGGRHSLDFMRIETKFKQEFEKEVKGILNKYDFKNNELITDEGTIQIRVHNHVTSGTNFSVHCGIQIMIKENGKKEFYQLNSRVLRSIA